MVLLLLAAPCSHARLNHQLTLRAESAVDTHTHIHHAHRAQVTSSCTPPDASAILASESWGRAQEVNRKITGGYAKLAKIFQKIVDPSFTGRTTSVTSTWFAVAPHASHEVGAGEAAMKAALVVLDSSTLPSYSSMATSILRGAGVSTSTISGQLLHAAVKTVLTALNLDVVLAAFVVELVTALQTGSATVPRNLFIDRRCGSTHICHEVLTVTFTRAAALVLTAPGSSLKSKLRAVARTGLAMLEHGNRLIFGHVADAAEQYLTWRESQVGCGATMPSADVLSNFKLKPLPHRVVGVPASTSGTNSVKTITIFREVGTRLSRANDDMRSVLSRHRCVDIMVAAFAAWEKGADQWARGSRTDGSNWIKAGNNMMAYCEQAEAVAPAFRPDTSGGRHTTKSVGDRGRVRAFSGEVSREFLMQLLTPFVKIGLNGHTWTLDNYGKNTMRSDVWTISKNWGKFSNRYVPILHGAFVSAYGRHPRSLWPVVTR